MVLFAVGTLGITLVLAYMTIVAARILQHGPLSYNPLLHPVETLFRLALVGLCGLLIWGSGLPAWRFGFVSIDLGRDVVLGVVLGVVIVWGVNVLSLYVLSEETAGLYSKNALLSMRPRSAGEMGMTVPAALPAAALEELLFRSMWIGGFSIWVPAPTLIVLTAVVFGVMHLAQGFWGVLITGLIGLFFGILFVWSGSFWLLLVTHWVMNLNQFALAWLRPDFFDLRESVDESSVPMIDSG